MIYNKYRSTLVVAMLSFSIATYSSTLPCLTLVSVVAGLSTNVSAERAAKRGRDVAVWS